MPAGFAFIEEHADILHEAAHDYNLRRKRSFEVFEANLDSFIEDGLILEEDREYYMERYEWCLNNGYRSVGTRSGGCYGGGIERIDGHGW